MNRRNFLSSAVALPLAGGLSQVSGIALAQQLPFNPQRSEKWRTFEITTTVELAKPGAMNRAWVPLPSVDEEWQKTLGNSWSGNSSAAEIVHDSKYGAGILKAEWAGGVANPVIAVTSRFATRDRAIEIGKPLQVAALSPDERAFYTAPTELIPTGGLVRKTALEIVKGKTSDVDKARAIYEWIVDNTFRDPKTRGCGVGDISYMLESRNLGGKCADLNALYVGLARSVGLPARDVYGIRVVKSQFGYRSLGAGTENITRAQHCRAEVWLAGYGWLPVDPADVRKVVLEEKPQPTTLADPVVPPVRQRLFGAWEMNWLAYNTAHDVALPGSKGKKLGFLMYPQAEVDDKRLDSLDPDNFKYRISAREITA